MVTLKKYTINFILHLVNMYFAHIIILKDDCLKINYSKNCLYSDSNFKDFKASSSVLKNE